MDLNLQANLFIYDAKVGDFYLSGGNKIEVTKRTEKKIHFSNGVIVTIKTLPNGMLYLTSKSVVRKNKPYPVVGQMIRDIEGYLLYLIHCQIYLSNMKIIITEEQQNKLNSYLRRIYGFMIEYLDENFSQQDICDSPYSDEEWDKETFGNAEDHFVKQNLKSIIYHIAMKITDLEDGYPYYKSVYEHVKTIEKLINEGGYEQHIRDYFNEALENC